MNVLSLFDGISCGQIALERANIKVNKYYASEIYKNAIKVTMFNYPETIQLGDIRNIDTKKLPKIDLLIGGSPCTNFSSSGKRNGMTTKDKIILDTLEKYLQLKEEYCDFDGFSYLFWEYVRILKEVQPKYFLLENVKMNPKWEHIITETLGVRPIEINSSLVSAQNRVRLYWTNIPNVNQPSDKNINLVDILEDIEYVNPAAVRGRQLNKGTIVGRRLNKDGHRDDYNTKIPYTQCLEVRESNTNKSNCLTTVAKDNVLTPLGVGIIQDWNMKDYKHYQRDIQIVFQNLVLKKL